MDARRSEAGVRHGIGLLREKIERDMALLGITTLAVMGRERIWEARGFGNSGSGKL
jgi:isopentenyl diphosphate isomerase/L-lactate dehydrogenase-like FMN-dependent dehydrogenase